MAVLSLSSRVCGSAGWALAFAGEHIRGRNDVKVSRYPGLVPGSTAPHDHHSLKGGTVKLTTDEN